MGRLRLLLLCLALAGLAAGVADAAPAPKPRMKNVNGWIRALAMDGSQVAYATQAFAPTNCFKLFTWNVKSQAGVLVSGPKAGNCHDDQANGQAISAVAIAGSRLAWIRNITGNTESDDTLFTASLPKPKTVKLAAAVRRGDMSGGHLKGSWIGGLVGSGTVLAVNTWTTGASGAVNTASLKTVGARHLTKRASGAGTMIAESADTGRVAVARSTGKLAIYSASGSLLRTIKSPAAVKEVALRKDFLVVLTRGKLLEIYNSHTGKFIREWPVMSGAAHLDVNSNIAVYSIYRRLYGVQLTTGKQIVLAAEKRAIVGAEIEAAGVVFAYNTVKGTKDIGNLVFLPLAGVKASLSS